MIKRGAVVIGFMLLGFLGFGIGANSAQSNPFFTYRFENDVCNIRLRGVDRIQNLIYQYNALIFHDDVWVKRHNEAGFRWYSLKNASDALIDSVGSRIPMPRPILEFISGRPNLISQWPLFEGLQHSFPDGLIFRSDADRFKSLVWKLSSPQRLEVLQLTLGSQDRIELSIEFGLPVPIEVFQKLVGRIETASEETRMIAKQKALAFSTQIQIQQNRNGAMGSGQATGTIQIRFFTDNDPELNRHWFDLFSLLE